MEFFGCRGQFPDIGGPTHRYMSSIPGCWAAFGQVLAREYSDRELVEIHRLSVDAYAIQHPGEQSPQKIGSVGAHLIRLCLFQEHGLRPERANYAMLNAKRNKKTFVWLDPPASPGAITVADVINANRAPAHKKAVQEWAKTAWQAWSARQAQVRIWLSASQEKFC